MIRGKALIKYYGEWIEVFICSEDSVKEMYFQDDDDVYLQCEVDEICIL